MKYNYETSKYSKFNKSNTHHGIIAAWVRKHPNFTPIQLKSSNICSAPKAEEYYEEFIAYRQFFQELEKSQTTSDVVSS